jgi:hypothetical protein
MTPIATPRTASLGGRMLSFSERNQSIVCSGSDAFTDVPREPFEAATEDDPFGLSEEGRSHAPFRHRASFGGVVRRTIGGLNSELRFDGLQCSGRLHDLLAAFPAWTPRKPAQFGWVIRKKGARIRIKADAGATRFTAPNGLVPSVKALLTECVLNRAEHLVALHGAVIAGPRGATLLVGAPGAGKSTLAAVCMGLGTSVLCDDLVLLHADGRITPVPFALTLKAGGWAIAAPVLPSLAGRPFHIRPDGCRVRYLPLRQGSDRRRTVERIVLLDREIPDPALRPIDPTLILAELLEGGHRPGGRLNGQGFEALTTMIGRAETSVLTGSDARACATLLGSA